MDSCSPEKIVAAETQQALVHAGYILEKFCRQSRSCGKNGVRGKRDSQNVIICKLMVTKHSG
jgi:hypothetical protein